VRHFISNFIIFIMILFVICLGIIKILIIIAYKRGKAYYKDDSTTPFLVTCLPSSQFIGSILSNKMNSLEGQTSILDSKNLEQNNLLHII